MDTVYDVAVIGGGPGGVYLAWRLQTEFAKGKGSAYLPRASGTVPSIMLYEGSTRIGGRLESLVPPGAPHLVAEFGGMGYSTNHVLVKALVEDKFQLPYKPLVMGTPQTINYLRGAYFRNSQVTNPANVPYRLAPDESGKSFGEILGDALASVVPGFPNLTDDQWYDWSYSSELNGQPLWQVNVWNFLASLISNEAYNYVQDAIGHMPFLGTWNAAEAIPWNFIDARDGTDARTLVGGYDLIPKTLFAQYMAAGGQVTFEKRLVKFEPQTDNGDFRWQLSFADGTTAYAVALVLAMPRRALEIITPGTLLELPQIQSLIKTVTPIPHLKIFFAYDQPWWESCGVTEGHSITDLPIRTLYYEGAESERGGDPNNHNALLMASYTDGRYLRYWEGVMRGEHYPDQPNPFVGPPPTPDYWHQQPVSVQMVNDIQRQLKLVHQLSDIPMPYSAAWRDWRMDPFGGAWNAWNAGVHVPTVVDQMLRPLTTVGLPLPLFVVGSAYSRWQGWVEGAFQTVERLLNADFGLDKPDWVP